jgi:serine protease Do
MRTRNSLAPVLSLCLAQACFNSCSRPKEEAAPSAEKKKTDIVLLQGEGDLASYSISPPHADISKVKSNRVTPEVLAIDNALASVVNIECAKVKGPVPINSQKEVETMIGLGSAVVINKSGYMVTNLHVIEGNIGISIITCRNMRYSAEVVYSDQSMDLAILKVSGPADLPVAKLGASNDLMLGETVITIGNPFGYSSSVSKGIVSAVGRSLQCESGQSYQNLIQTDAPINPGCSGGALININGEVVGICVAMRGGSNSIGFAIPIDDVKKLIERVKAQKTVYSKPQQKSPPQFVSRPLHKNQGPSNPD